MTDGWQEQCRCRAVGANVCAVSGDSKLSSSSSYAAMEVAHLSVVEVTRPFCDFIFYVILGPIPSVLGASKCMHKSIHVQFAPISKAASTTSSLIVISLSNILLTSYAATYSSGGGKPSYCCTSVH